jgi:PIN domain nuclease of toxin-antitoxin system
VTLLLNTRISPDLLAAPERLGSLRSALEDDSTTFVFSAASSWGIAIKHAVGRLDLPEPPSSYVPARTRDTGVTATAVEHAHALATGGLPRHHDDPIDRLLVAQARSYEMPLMTVDDAIAAYEVRGLRL